MLTRIYALTAFVAALLLFVVQPLVGKRLLPAFGGSPATFTTCLLFFQLVLLAGYALAERLARAAGRLQPLLALLPVACALALLPLGWGHAAAAAPAPSSHPALAIFEWLTRGAGPPCLALAMASPLLTHFYPRVSARAPHALYAYSNAGSLLGLLAYPFVIEPRSSWPAQARAFELGFALYAAGMLIAALGALRASEPAPASAAPESAPAPRPAALLRWVAFSALSSALLLAVTSQLTLDIAAVPFLWVAPLALYLLSFVIAFAERARDRRALLLPCWVMGSLLLAIDPFQHAAIPAPLASAALLSALFVFGLLCHGELARTRPAPRHLARFYLAIAIGGALGGLFVALLAPLLFSDMLELQLILAASYALLLAGVRAEADPALRRIQARYAYLGLGLCAPLLAGTLWVHAHGRTQAGQLVERHRDFYGVLSVTDLDGVRLLSHGRIRHGMQFLDPARRRWPTLYYGRSSGAGLALARHRAGEARRIGLIGLGAGTLAVYATARDRLRFYELDPGVIALARRHFSFLADSPARIEIAPGDARLSLAREPAQRFDLLVLDAFASDAVPVHLLTEQAFAIYLRHLRPDGLLLVNVANRHLALERVVAGAAARHGLALRMLETPSDRALGTARVRWVLLAREQAALEHALANAGETPLSGTPVVFSDDFSDLLSVLR